jgi:hypothetical protein
MPEKTDKQIELAEARYKEAQNTLREGHSTPAFNLFDEKWINVIGLDGLVESVSLDTLFRESHHIRDIAEHDPLINFALRRLIVALAVQLVRLHGSYDKDEWLDRLEDEQGFTGEQVNRLVANQKDYFWLWHPDHPFLQDIRLIDSLTSIEFVDIADAVPHLPGSGESAWFVKPNSQAFSHKYQNSEVAKILTGRWFYNLSGNTTAVILPISNERGKRSQRGGAFAGDYTQFFRISSATLFHSTLRNIVEKFFEPFESNVSGPAWMDEKYPSVSDDPLYRYTVTFTSALLGPCSNGEQTMVRGAVAKDGDAKEYHDEIRGADIHACRYASGKTKSYVSTVRISPSDYRSKIVEELVKTQSVNEHTSLASVTNKSNLWLADNDEPEVLLMLMCKLGGSTTSRKWEDVRLSAITSDLTNEQSQTFQMIKPVAMKCFDSSSGMRSLLRDSIGIAIKNNEKKSMINMAEHRWMDVASQYTDILLEREINADEFLLLLRDSTFNVFDSVMEKYQSSMKYAAQVICARSILRRRMWKTYGN